MSTASKVTLGVSCVASVAIIAYVHWRQVDDRTRLHQGIVRDEERQLAKKQANLYKLQEQRELEKILKAKRDEAD